MCRDILNKCFVRIYLLTYAPGIVADVCCCCSVAKSCLTLCHPMDCSKPGFPVLHCLPEFAQPHVHWVGDAIQPFHSLLHTSFFAFHLSQCQGLSQWVSLHIRWPKYWSFNFSISPSNKYSELISLRIDWSDLLAVQGTLESSSTPDRKSVV